MRLYKINLSQLPYVLVGEAESVVEEAFGAVPDAVDLVECGGKKSAARGEKQVEVVRLADAEGHERDADEDPEILESAGAVRPHIVAHDLVAVNAESEKCCCRNNARAVLALRAMPKHRAVVLKKNAEKLAQRLKRGFGGDHCAVGVGKVGSRAAFDLHDLFEDRGPRVPRDGGVLLVGQGRDVEIINALGHDVALMRKLCGRAEVDDCAKTLAVAQFLGNFKFNFAQMTASVKLTVANALAVRRGNTAKIAEILDFSCHIVLLCVMYLILYHKFPPLSTALFAF